MKKDKVELGKISKILLESSLKSYTYEVIRDIARGVNKYEVIEDLEYNEIDMPIEEIVAIMMGMVISTDHNIRLIVSDYGVDFVAQYWSEYIAVNVKYFRDKAEGELETMNNKMNLFVNKFVNENSMDNGDDKQKDA